MWPNRRVLGFFGVCLCCAFGLILERKKRESLAFADHPVFASLARKIPNYRHVWFAWNLVDTNGYLNWIFSQDPYPVNVFGYHILSHNASWEAICELDSDQDGLSNGMELGDPCCRWRDTPDVDFDLQRNLEYRRWMASHPAHPTARNGHVHSFPQSCDEEYDAEQYRDVFRTFYFSRLDAPREDVPWSLVKLAAFIFMSVQVGLWFQDGLAHDLLGSKSPLSGGLRLALVVASFLYMERARLRTSERATLLIFAKNRRSLAAWKLGLEREDFSSGVIHLILDYAPTFLPVLGGLAGGFRYHHEDPTAICRISWFEYASHTHLLAVVVLFVLRLGPHSRGLRFFWTWGLVWSHLFQSAHRWTHFPPEQLNGWISSLQHYLVLTHERHMEHHQDLEKQFTILSGYMDVFLDPLVKLVPAANYDYWCVFGVLWFFIPNFLDCFFLQQKKQKVEDEYV